MSTEQAATPPPSLAPSPAETPPDHPTFSQQEWAAINEPQQALTITPVRGGGGWRWFLFFLLLAGIVGGPLAYWFWPSSIEVATDLTGTVTRGDLQVIVTERGELESSKTVDARCEVEGRQIKIIEIAPEGKAVKKDEVVVKFDTEELTKAFQDQEVKWKQADGKANASREELKVQENKKESEIDKAKLALITAELELEKYFHPKGEYQKLVDTSKSGIAKAERELEIAKEELKNFQIVVNRGFETPETLRRAETKVQENELMLSTAKKDLYILEFFTKKIQEAKLQSAARDAKNELERTRSSTQAAVLKAKSELEAAEDTAKIEKRALDRLKKQLGACEIKAPSDGIMVYANDRYWDEQSRVRPGGMVYYQQTIFRLPDLTNMRVKVKVHESQVKKVKKDQPVDILIDALPNKILHGKVLTVATLADNRGPWDERGVKEYVTEVGIDDLPPEAGIKPGMTAEVRIMAQEFKNVLMVPVQAICERDGKHYAYQMNGSVASRKTVSVGDNNEKFIIITDGVKEGDKLALNARRRLSSEMRASNQELDKAGKTVATNPAPAPAAPVATK
ncbi:MAG: efflux RND transporter periplasmic adaptor subunit [Gemmatales bacterium]